jgi:uracil-DNA glycosylase
MTYPCKTHPIIESDLDCAACSLGDLRREHNVRAIAREESPQWCVHGNGPEDLSKVKLIVISDYPGAYEVKEGYPMVDKFRDRPEVYRGKVQPRNAGNFLRRALHLMYGLDTYTDCWITNAVKCSPNKVSVIEGAHIKPCTNKWLTSEFQLLDLHCPQAPTLVVGTHAFRAIKHLYKSTSAQLDAQGVIGSRRKVHIINGRPFVFSFNPAIAARSEPRIETAVKQTSKGTYISTTDWLYPPLPGSPIDKFIKDLRLLADYIHD